MFENIGRLVNKGCLQKDYKVLTELLNRLPI